MPRRAKNVEPQTELLDTEKRERAMTAPHAESYDPEQLMALAISKGGVQAAEVIERLTRLRMEMQAVADRKELFGAVAKFQEQCPSIPKSSTAKIAGRGGAFEYSYADLEQIVETIRRPLMDNSLSYSWDAKANDNGSRLSVTCVLRHANGQSVSAMFDVPTESAAGMSPQQKYAAAQMFGRRKSLEQVLGLVAVDIPDRVATDQDPTPVNEEQAANVNAMIEETKADVPRFLKYFGVATVAELPARRYGEAVQMLEQKRRGW